MPLETAHLEAVIFDYGNTLIEFSHAQVAHCDRAFSQCLVEAFGPHDAARFKTIRDDQRRAPYFHTHRERAMDELASAVVRELYGMDPTPQQVRWIVDARHRAFVEAVTLPPGVRELLGELRQRYKVALLSNYPCAKSITESLVNIGLADAFDAVVISAEVGYVKPHAAMYDAALDVLSVTPGQAVMVGDNWLGDIQGAHRTGLQTIHITQYQSIENFDRQPGDVDADLTIEHINKLATCL